MRGCQLKDFVKTYLLEEKILIICTPEFLICISVMLKGLVCIMLYNFLMYLKRIVFYISFVTSLSPKLCDNIINTSNIRSVYN